MRPVTISTAERYAAPPPVCARWQQLRPVTWPAPDGQADGLQTVIDQYGQSHDLTRSYGSFGAPLSCSVILGCGIQIARICTLGGTRSLAATTAHADERAYGHCVLLIVRPCEIFGMAGTDGRNVAGPYGN